MNSIILVSSTKDTGGTHCLHQLGEALSRRGLNVSVHYHNYYSNTPPPHFRRYLLPQGSLEDSKSTVLIIPETLTSECAGIKKSRVIVYWLSLDNYFGPMYNNMSLSCSLWIRIKYRMLRYRLSLGELRRYLHLSQSFYTSRFLSRHRLRYLTMIDYVSPAVRDGISKEQIVSYNPAKGHHLTQRLIKMNPDIEFIPIVNMSKEEVDSLLSRSMLYIDFGHHPGRDRLPREAALHGCVVLTSRKGSANNTIDVPIGSEYKLAHQKPSFYCEASAMMREILDNYSYHSLKQLQYVQRLHLDNKLFHEQVDRLVCHLGHAQ